MLEFFTVLSIVLLAVMAPGPDFAVVTKNAFCYSRKAGIFTTLGIATGTLIHVSYCLFGLAIIITKSLLLFTIIKYIGAAYLIYIGIKAIFSKNAEPIKITEVQQATMSNSQAFRQGFLCNLLNPKAILFFLALFTLILKPNTPLVMQIVYGLLNPVIAIIWFSILSYLITHRSVKNSLGKVQHIILKIMGGCLIAFGIRVATLAQHVL